MDVYGIKRVWYKPDGSALRCSAAAYEILQGTEDGSSDDEMVERLTAISGVHISLSQYAHARRVTLAKAKGICLKRNLSRQGILWHRQVLGPAATDWVSRPLLPLFRLGLAVPLLVMATLTCVAAAWTGLSRGWQGYVFFPSEIQAFCAYGLFLVVLIMHEAGHAAALHSFGGKANGAGIGLFIIFPFFYTDVTRSWSLPPHQRVIVDLGGLYVQFLIMAPMLLAFAFYPNACLMMALGLMASTCVLAANPFLRNDGYWALSDMLDRPALKQDAYRSLWTAKRRPYALGGLRLYAVLDTLFLLFLMGVAARRAWLSSLHPEGHSLSPASWCMLAGSVAVLVLLGLRLHSTLRPPSIEL